MRVKELIQHDESDCGAACLAIVLSFYGRETSIRKFGKRLELIKWELLGTEFKKERKNLVWIVKDYFALKKKK
ncbi:MAG: hypothetical protein J6Q47_03985 [Paludibacteraceae bacterium]|nr:hypothetical protein [Paludibacteraceae bacterium]